VLATRGTHHVENMLIRTTSLFARGVSATAEDTAHTTLNASHLTIVGEGSTAGDIGVRASAASGLNALLNLTHSIVRGYGTSLSSQGAGSRIDVGASDFDFASKNPPGSGTPQITESSTNRDGSTDPGFVNAAGGDYRLLFSSPDVDRSALETTIGPNESATDLAGTPRIIDGVAPFDGAKRDLGAFEYQGTSPTATAAAAPGSVLTGDPVTFSGSGADTDPGESIVGYAWAFDDGPSATGATTTRMFSAPGVRTGSLTVTDSSGRTASAVATVTVNPRPTTGGPGPVTSDTTAPVVLSAKKRRTRTGVTFTYALSEAASVQISFERRRAGRRVGRRCVKPTRRNRRRKACVRHSRAGSVSRVGALGTNRFAFNGRIGGSDLALGSYRATFRATDAAGNRSVPRRLAFSLVGP
jgi:hypothetical protein